MIEKFSSHGKIVELSKYDKIFNISNCFRPDTKILGMSETLNVKGFMKTAGSNVVKIAPQEQDFIYIRIRAVSAGNVIEHKDGTYELPANPKTFWRSLGIEFKLADRAEIEMLMPVNASVIIAEM